MNLPNAKDQPDHGIKYLRVGAVANTLCHGLGCIQLLGRLLILSLLSPQNLWESNEINSNAIFP